MDGTSNGFEFLFGVPTAEATAAAAIRRRWCAVAAGTDPDPGLGGVGTTRCEGWREEDKGMAGDLTSGTWGDDEGLNPPTNIGRTTPLPRTGMTGRLGAGSTIIEMCGSGPY
eukprot:CAMPEP_0175058592 /NCGR_PEP_ID=MMETSP0052_2-20121109/11938_1 /TAXON_ID=51329 ORGANISM="Polytomella parva, Strain SAG 63-3" /NCGR_SAMPLE_ID=MMETSP0052_2 /ASSEMBLY_ACC=CAM_ASM_000194 /LENGTH=111 /DNA_ID=CAMNT_0016323999 /DNA_START=100 /DNA_END=435 /DNA_ORIENTATION=+